jgi:hypothetical protein
MLIQSRKVKEDYFGGRANCSDAKFSKKILEKIMGFKHTTQDQDFYLALGPEFYSYGYCTQ